MRVLGLDGGIASIGWAILDLDGERAAIHTAGVRTFDAPETDKDRTPSNAIRRLHRGQRRVIRRRRQRMAELRRLFHRHGLLPAALRDALRQPGLDPWGLRAAGLERRLDGAEFAVTLGHIARHRGFRSNAKRDRGANATDDTSKMLKAIATTQERLGQWETVGLMFARDPAFETRKHNRGQDYSRSVLRADLEHEVRTLFAAQRRLGNTAASDTLEEAYTATAFFQRSLQDSEHMVRTCRFEPTEKCTARRSYAFEMFRLLSRLGNLTLTSGGTEWKLSPEQAGRIAGDFGRQKKITWRSLRKTLDLDPRTRFAGVAEKDETQDVVARSGNAAEGSYALRQAVGDTLWLTLMLAPDRRDRIAEVLTFREYPASIHTGLLDAGADGGLLDALMRGVETGAFTAFSGAGHISAKAARTLIPALAQGLVYSEACKDVGYDHTAPGGLLAGDFLHPAGWRALVPALDEQVRNPVARKALSEMLKQVRAIVQTHGLPDAIHVELARDIGKSAEERDAITRGIEDRNRQRDRLRQELSELLGRDPGLEELVRFELWKEQNGRCLYTDESIDPRWISEGDNRVQVDHILPWSRFGDDSFVNKTLCLASANQAKRGRTPFEWFTEERLDWTAFAARVDGCKEMKPRKKRGFYLRQNASEVEERFRSRNLNDTRYATRLLLGLLSQLYPKDKRQVLARPGQLTAKLRRAWGVEDLKKDADGKRRQDDRHHALDAIVLAATSESMLQRLTQAAQAAERQGAPRGFDFTELPAPPGFRDAVRVALDAVFVSRAERHRARGEAHAATIRQVRQVDGKPVVFDRKPIEKLKPADLELIPVPEPYGRIADPAKLRDEMVAELRRWIEEGRPKDRPPLSPKGDPIRKVRVASKDKPAVSVRDGTADRGEMARVDVFAKADARGRKRFFLVPVYPHQVADRTRFPKPPDRAVVQGKLEADWTVMDGTFAFLFSLTQNSLAQVTTPDGELIRGYFKGLDRSTGAIALAAVESTRKPPRRIGAKTLQDFRKFAVDRLGRVSAIESEKRTWHGEVCT